MARLEFRQRQIGNIYLAFSYSFNSRHLSETLPQNTVVIAVNLDVDNIGTTFEVGTDADTESALIITQATISGDTRVQFPAHDKGAGSIAVGGKKLIATVGATPTASKAVSGYILIATQE